eukprot:TRINITY_DN75275_c0_g1_i1.p1 TRINITY_DN75275_c0_g1~~TRINITY_DN75275_c0_g1_i1.p1  ORF type:complete len:349 (-),score=103.78 TRINITY_DN75275_c0_g1_i1:542-1588(-)
MQPQPMIISSGVPAAGGYASARPVTYASQPAPTRQFVSQAGASSVNLMSSTRVLSSSASMSQAPSMVYASSQPVVRTAVPSTSYTLSPATRSPVTTMAAPTVIRQAAPMASTTSPTIIRAAQPAVRTTAPVLGPAYTQTAYVQKHKEDPELERLKDVRKTCGLKEVPVKEALLAMNAAGGPDGQLNLEHFLKVYDELLAGHGVVAPSKDVQNAVFELFDRDSNGIVDKMELVCGISLLCAGSEDDKIHAVFDIFDMNGDGFISMDEMYKFLTSVFKVVLTPNVKGVMNSMGVTVESAEDLASVTSLECFKAADLNQDGKLSVEEFKSWFFSPKNDPSFMFSPVRKLLQ